MEILITTITKRPYVFAFLTAYLVLAWRLWGPKRTFIWLVFGYLIAWLSEVSSINNGFPYGEYHYIYENLRGELLVAGVPFFDSLSYPFMVFAGFSLAKILLVDSSSKFAPFKAIVLGAFLTMLLDVMVDPVTRLGARWFLGEIYYYANEGFYFGVPLSNFAGWFIVPLAIIAFNALLWRAFPSLNADPFYSRVNANSKTNLLLYAGFYFGIAAFELSITIYLREWKILTASLTIMALVTLFSFRAVKRRIAL